tara:strand:+ start:449 stop:1222 length:774 start_codon:yes stop_codon:yes gene_type:complete
MVLARDLHQKIQDMQIKIEGSKRIAHLENEITTLTDAVHLLVSKLEKPIEEENTPDPYKDKNGETKKIDKEAIPDEEEPDIEEEDEDEEEPEEEEEEPDDEDDEIDEEELNEFREPELASQVWEKKHLKELSGYKADKEKLLHGEAHKWTDRDDILADNFTVILKRIIFYTERNYSHLEHIEYLEIKCKNKLKYITLTNLLQLILSITNKTKKLDKPIEFSICNTKYEFNERAKYLVNNLITFFKKVSKLKETRFSQ